MSKEKRILILDDQPEITEIVEDFINDKYTDVITVTSNDPKDALELLQSEFFSLVITDHHMPEVSGIDVVTSLRTGDSLNKAKPVVFLTAMKNEVEAEIGGKFEDIIFINKIDQIKKIVDVIEKYLL